MPSAVRFLSIPAIVQPLLILAGCATAPPQPSPAASAPPTGATFAEWVATGRADPETFDFSAAGYWKLAPMERFQWQQPTLEAAQRVFTGGSEPCSPQSRRQGASMLWMMMLNQVTGEADWTINATALRARLAQLDAELAAVKPASTATDPRVAELLARFARDQAVRRVFTENKWVEGLPPLAAKNWTLAFISRMTAIDCANTAWLKTQLSEVRWFDIPTYGAEADTAAWYLVQHADREPEFQRRMLKELEALPPGHTDAKRIAYLWDRVALADKRLQRYGTQGRCADGTWKPSEVEDPEHLDERRKTLGMEPIAVHAQTVSREACPK